MSDTIKATLQRIPIFTLTTEEQLNKLVADSREISLAANQLIFAEGDEPDGMYVILEGTVRVHLSDDSGVDIELTRMGAGEVFGELAVLDSGPRTASVSTVTDCTLLHIGEEAFLDLLLYSRSLLVYEMLRDIVGNIRENSQRIMRQEVERMQTEAQMELARQRALNQMVAGIAHELNTPLGIVNTASSVISQRLQSEVFSRIVADDPEVKSALEDVVDAAGLISRNISRAHRLVRAFKKISVSQLIDEIEKVDLPDLIGEIIELFKINARRAGIEVEIVSELADEQKIWQGYPGFLSQVLMNLLTNIERYAYPNGMGGRVELILSTTDTLEEPGYQILVRDFGQGIAAEEVGRVFEPFYTTGRGQGGTGLGLTIVQNIVTGPLQGQVSVTSEPGSGTTFIVQFPQTIEKEPSDNLR